MVVYAPAQIISAPAQLITAPAQPPTTGAVMYTALFSIQAHNGVEIGESSLASTINNNDYKVVVSYN